MHYITHLPWSLISPLFVSRCTYKVIKKYGEKVQPRLGSSFLKITYLIVMLPVHNNDQDIVSFRTDFVFDPFFQDLRSKD